MKEIGWRFPPLSGGPPQSCVIGSVEMFKGKKVIENFIRETCQNSLDAKNPNMEGPVTVIIKTFLQDVSNEKVFEGHKEALESCERYWHQEPGLLSRIEEYLVSANKQYEKEKIAFMVCSDYNTSGAYGCKTKQIKCPWNAMIGSGISFKPEGDSGGSYGFGHDTAVAVSSLGMVFYNTKSIAPNGVIEEGFIGTVQMATLYNKDGKLTQRTGYYQVNDEENEEYHPIYPEDFDSFRDQYKRTEFGTDIIIPGFSYADNWIEEAQRAVMANFLVAIMENRLIVELRDEIHGNAPIIIDANRLPQIFEEKSENWKSEYQVWQTYLNPTIKVSKKIYDASHDDDLEVYVKFLDKYPRKIFRFRRGMMIGYTGSRINRHFICIVVVKGRELSELLKETEPPEHNKWDYTLISMNHPVRRRDAKKALEDINGVVKDLLYSVDNEHQDTMIEATGIGFNDEGISGGVSVPGTDILRPKLQISSIKRVQPRNGITITQGRIGEGTPVSGEVRNFTDNIIDGHNGGPTPVVIPDPDNIHPVRGVQEGTGTKKLTVPAKMKFYRGYMKNFEKGEYIVNVIFEEDYDNVSLRIFYDSEDKDKDLLSFRDFYGCTANPSTLEDNDDKFYPNFNEQTAGPFSVKAEVLYHFYATFSTIGEKLGTILELVTEVDE